MFQLMALYKSYYYECRRLWIFTFFFFLCPCIILPFIIHHSVRNHRWLYLRLVLFLSSIHHSGLQGKLLNALQHGLFILRCGVLLSGLFANQRGISVVQCGELYRSKRPCFLVFRLLWQARVFESPDIVWLSVCCRTVSCSGLCLLWRVRFIELGQTWHGHLFFVVLHCVPVFVC